jgi:O-antigen ligase
MFAEAKPLPPEVGAVCYQILGATYILCNFIFIRFLRRRSCHLPSWQGIQTKTVILSTIFIAGVSGALIMGLGARRALLGAGLGGGIVLSFAHPTIAASFLMENLILRPWEVLKGDPVLTLVPKAAAAISMISWVFFALRTNRVILRWNRGCTLFTGVILWLFLSVVMWGAESDALQSLFNAFYPIATLCFILLNSIERRDDFFTVELVLALAVLGEVIQSFWVTSQLTGFGGENRLIGVELWGNSNDIAALIIYGLPFIAAPLVAKRGGILLRLLSALSVLLCVVAIGVTQSRAAIVALGMVVAGYVLINARFTVFRVILLGGAGAIMMVLMSSIQRGEGDLEGSSASRWNYVLAGINMVRAYPVFGVGFGNYSLQYENFTPAFVEWGARTAHSSWVLIFSEAGPIALLFFGGLFIWSLYRAWKGRHTTPECFMALCGYGFKMSVLSHSYLFPPYLLFTLVAASSVVRRYEEVTAVPSRIR